MLESYRGTVDDDGETLDDAREEVRRMFDGEYGSPLLDVSVVAEHGPRVGGASLVTLWQGQPLLAFTMTHPEAKNRGLATALVSCSIDLLRARGNDWLRLVVTEGNEPAIHLYEKLGFLRTP